MVMSPGLDELTTLLGKLQGREDAITRELERRGADVLSEIAAVKEAIRALEAEHAADPSVAEVPEVRQESAVDDQTPVALPAAQDAPADAYAVVVATEAPAAAPEPVVSPSLVSAPPARPRRARGPNWQRELA